MRRTILLALALVLVTLVAAGVLPAFAVAFALQRYLVKGLALGGTKG